MASLLGAELVLVEVVAWPPMVYGDGSAALGLDYGRQVADAETYLETTAQRLRKPGLTVRCRAEISQNVAAMVNSGSINVHASTRVAARYL